jgi:hypothetical protein
MNFWEAFFLNFKHYMLKARSGLRARALAEPTVDVKTFAEKVLAERFCHSDQLSERFELIKQIAQNSSVRLNLHYLTILWEELVILQMF